jgi:PIN domain nuclease of toxin-antitoxin system
MATTKTDRSQSEPGSVMHMDDGVTLRTACGHSFAHCHTDRCFRLPPELRDERDRLLTAATIEHSKNIASEATRFDSERRSIERTYRDLAAEQND